MAQIDIGKLAFTHKGDYAGGTAYVANDVVYYNGSAYIAKTSTTGNLPTSTAHWNTFSAGSGGIWNSSLSLGSANQSLRVNSGGSALEFYTPSAGGVLQVKSTTKTDTQSISASSTRADITGLYLDLTPSSASNKVLVWFNVSHWGNDSHCQIERRIGSGSFSIISPSSEITGSRTSTHSGGSHRNTYELNTANMTILDAPNTTSALRYKITFNNGPSGGTTGYINRTENDNNDSNGERAISTITAMEIASGVL
jgi:hypothetical protein